MTTADFFPMFDGLFQYDSGWTVSDEESRTPLVVIADFLNDRLFAGTNSVGRSIYINDKDFGHDRSFPAWVARCTWTNLASFADAAFSRDEKMTTLNMYQGVPNMTQPFEDNQSQFLVLVNDEGQHSLWPGFAEVPAGWKTCFGPETRQLCLEYVEREWVDMRPLSLIKAMEQSAQ